MRSIQSLIKLSPALLAVLFLAGPVPAMGAPCCTITDIDTKNGVVGARETTTGRQFKFSLTNPVLMRRIKVGQGVQADFAAGKVTVVGIDGRYSIIDTAPAATGSKGTKAAPSVAVQSSRPAKNTRPTSAANKICCTITAVDPRRSVVTAQETATGRTFTFTVSDTSVLGGLRVGQPVHAHFASKQVSLDGRKPCCQMASSSTGAKSRPPTSGTTMFRGRKGAAADQSTGTSGGGMGRRFPAPGDANEAGAEGGSAAGMPSDPTPESAQNGYPQTPADSAWPSDYGSGLPSDTADTGYPVDDSGYGSFPSEQPGMQGEPPSLDGAKSYSYGGSGEAPLQGDVPWWKQPLPGQ